MQLVEVRQEARGALSAKENAEALAKSLRADLDSATASNKLKKENLRLKEELSAANDALKAVKNANGSLVRKENALRKELEQLRDELATSKNYHSGLKEKISELNRQLEAERRASASAVMKLSSEKQLRTAESSVQTRQRLRTTLKQEIERLREIQSRLESELAAKDKELARLRSMAKNGANSTQDLKSELGLKKQSWCCASRMCRCQRTARVYDAAARDAEMALNKKKAAKIIEADLKRCEKDLGMEQSSQKSYGASLLMQQRNGRIKEE